MPRYNRSTAAGRAAAAKKFGEIRDFAYRGYLVRHNLLGGIWIEKDGNKIAWAKDDNGARQSIDAVLGPEKKS